MRALFALLFALALPAAHAAGAGSETAWSFRVLLDDKVVGESYTLEISTEVIKGTKHHFLALA